MIHLLKNQTTIQIQYSSFQIELFTQQMSNQQKKPKDICTVRIIYIPYH